MKAVGSPLEKTGKLVSGKEKAVSDGPFAETKDLIGGYTLVNAKDIDEAVALSKGCPIFLSDGARRSPSDPADEHVDGYTAAIIRKDSRDYGA